MPHIDYKSLSLEELQSIQNDVAKAIKSFENQKRKKAKAELDALAKKLGFSSASDLVADGKTKGKTPTVPYYRNPENPKQVCGQSGRKPSWFNECLEKGYNREQLMIEKQS